MRQNIEKKLILYIDSGTFREDYARVYDEIYEQLINSGFSIKTILGPGSTLNIEKRFAHYSPILLKEIEVEAPICLQYIIFYISSILKKEQPFFLRKPWLNIPRFRSFVKFLIWLKLQKFDMMLSIKYDSCYEFVAAANKLGISTVAIQHGEESLEKLPKRVHEWPASDILVWDDFWKEKYESIYENQARFHSMNAILWHARYCSISSLRSKKIIFYESAFFPAELIEAVIKKFGKDRIFIKPHPYKLQHGLSLALKYFPDKIFEKNLWDELPFIGVSFGSTVTNELIYLDTPCISLVSYHDIGLSFPPTGSFPTDIDLEIISNLLFKLDIDPFFRKQFVDKQRLEKARYVVDSNPADRIASFCKSF